MTMLHFDSVPDSPPLPLLKWMGPQVLLLLLQAGEAVEAVLEPGYFLPLATFWQALH
jgi:hypothetical protein